MGIHRVYRLKFKTQLHLGRPTGAAQTGSLGLEKTETYIPADTLFSAICQMWTTFYDTQSLTDFLNLYIGESETLPFTLTSAFPFADDVYFFPKPLVDNNRPVDKENETDVSLAKKRKHVQFVSNSIFQDIIAGNSLTFNAADLINEKKVWASCEEIDHLKKLMDTDMPIIWEMAPRPRVTIGSRNAGSEIWHVEAVQFNKKCGLWFAATFDNDETRQRIETLLRVLGDNGIGGERNSGYGQFEFDKAELELPIAEDGDRFVTLSPICPKSSTQLQQLLTGDVAYTLSPCIGWVSVPGSDALRKLINMFREGSVLHTSEARVGRLVDLKPAEYTHPVYRYGYAWQVGIRGTSQ